MVGYSEKGINVLLRQPEKAVHMVLSLDNKVMQHLGDLGFLKIEFTVPNHSYVDASDVLGEIIYTIRENRERLSLSREVCKTYREKILAPCDGFLYIDEELAFYDYEKNGTVSWDCTNPELFEKELQRIALIFNSYDAHLFYYFKTDKAVIEKDPYTNLHKILWEHDDRGIYSDLGIIKLDYINDKAVLVYQVVDPEEKLIKGDFISLRFQNGQILDYLIQNEPTKVYPLNNVKDYYRYDYCFTLYKEDLILLIDDRLNTYHSAACFAMDDLAWSESEEIDVFTALDSYRITYRNNRLPAKTIPVSSLYMLECTDADGAIPIYTRCYLDALNRLVPNYKLPQRSINQCSMEYSFNWCYVYLMKDTSNGYYKIGISNTPEYRERTLQSEKPTIEMLACKKFPTRKIAESIESALHTTYSQQRLRGEWFNLTDADVAAIIETLK